MKYRTKLCVQRQTGDIYDDDVVVLFSSGGSRYEFTQMEFDGLCSGLHDLVWNTKTIKYIQFLKEWNECIGFNDIFNVESELKDIDDTIEAIE